MRQFSTSQVYWAIVGRCFDCGLAGFFWLLEVDEEGPKAVTTTDVVNPATPVPSWATELFKS